MSPWLKKLRRCFLVAMATFAWLFALAQFVRVIPVFDGKDSEVIGFLNENAWSLLVAFAIFGSVCLVMYLAEHLINSGKEREEEK